jgi:beta-ketoacyl-acyl-carrier-protein synthase II
VNRPRRRVAVTGLGVVSPVGGTVTEFFEGLVAGRSGVRRLPWREDTVAACVDFNADAHFSRMQLSTLDRFAQFGLVAAEQAVKEAGLSEHDFAGPRVGVYFGSSIGGAGAIENSYRAFLGPQERVSPMTILLTMANAAAAHVSLRYAIHGPSLTYSVACASAAVAIGEAFRAIRDGYVDLAIVGGAEALLVPGPVAGWKAMRVLATPDVSRPEQSCRPFSADRSGLVLGEGAGALVLESFDHAKGRGREPLAEIAGYGLSSDATHLAKPDTAGQVAAMRAALADAELEPSAIGYINAHGTATPVGDVVETESIREVFGDAAECVAVSSTKALHGHLLGASGAVEFIAALMALRTGTLPPTCHLATPDPECDLDFVPNEARRGIALRAVMSNSFAFGGTNAVLVARQALDR